MAGEVELTKTPRLIPNIVGSFRNFDDWVNYASCVLTGVKGSVGENVGAICVDSIGRRCNVGKDFMRARDEGTFPIYFFWDCEPPAGRAALKSGEG